MKHRNGMDDDAYDCMRSPKKKKQRRDQISAIKSGESFMSK
jgi:hypothetical protein